MLNMQDLVHQSRPLFAGDLLGTVVDNADPRQLGRIRVQIPGMMTNQLTNVAAGKTVGKYRKPQLTAALTGQSGLPWLAAANPPGTPSVDIPEIGATVGVRFRNGNPSEGQYVSTPLTAQSIPAELLVDYPNSYGWKNSKGDWFRVNKASGQWDIHHHSGYHHTIDDAGNVTVAYPKDLTETIAGNVTRTVTGNSTVHVEGTSSVVVDGDTTEQVKSRTLTVEGDLTTIASGSILNTAATQISNTAPRISNQGS